MHALLLALALGQAGPSVPPGQAGPPADASPPAAPVPATQESAVPATQVPAPPAAPGPAAPPGAPPAPPPRTVELARNADGTFLATLDGVPVSGAAFYRAVLRFDLADRAEEARFSRTALFIAAGVAPLVGLGMGWAAGTAHQWPLPPCAGEPPGPVDCTAHDQVAAQNQEAMRTALVTGGVAGVAGGALLWFLGSRVRLLEPTADEAEALVRAYRSRAAPAPGPGADRPAGASLRLVPGPGAVGLALRLRF